MTKLKVNNCNSGWDNANYRNIYEYVRIYIANSGRNEDVGKVTCDVTAAFLVGAGTRGGAQAAAEYIAKSPVSLGPLFALSFVECEPQTKVTLARRQWLDI